MRGDHASPKALGQSRTRDQTPGSSSSPLKWPSLGVRRASGVWVTVERRSIAPSGDAIRCRPAASWVHPLAGCAAVVVRG
jgi:hypothetical protein